VDRRIARQCYDRHYRLGKDGDLGSDTILALKELFTKTSQQSMNVVEATG